MEDRRRIISKKIKPYRSLLILIGVILCFIFMKNNLSAYSCYKTIYSNLHLPLFSNLGKIFGGAFHIFLFGIIVIRLLVTLVKGSFKTKMKGLLAGTLNLVSAFFIVWGFHYAQPSLPEVKNLSRLQLNELFSKTVNLSMEERDELVNSSILREFTLEKELRSELDSLLTNQMIALQPTNRDMLFPVEFCYSGGLRKMGISGIYFPFTGEPLVDKSASLLRKSFTYAHEFYHGQGVTGEDECNYLAYKTLVESESTFLHYVAHLDVILTTSYLLAMEEEELYETLSPEIVSDISFLKQDSKKYKSWFHSVSHSTNNMYLKLLSSEEGIAAYDSYVKWIVMTEE